GALVTRLGVALGIKALDFQDDRVRHIFGLPSVNPLARWPARDHNWTIFDSRRSLGAARRHRMREVLIVVALREIAPLMGAAGFLAIERAMHDGFRDFEHEAQLERRREL